MITECAKEPGVRFKDIEEIARDYQKGKVGATDQAMAESRRTFDAFTLEAGELEKTEARVLPPGESRGGHAAVSPPSGRPAV